MQEEYNYLRSLAEQKEEDLKEKHYLLGDDEKKSLIVNLKKKYDEIHRSY